MTGSLRSPADFLAELAMLRESWEQRLSADEDVQKAQRRAISERLDAAFVSIAAALEPSISVEIGAHEATYSQSIKAALPELTCIGLEANPVIHARYRDRLTALGIDYREVAASDSNGMSTLFVPVRDGKTKKSMSSLLEAETPSPAASPPTGHQVRTQRLDEIVPAGTPNVLWIDVEGAAGQVLAGAPNTLKSCLALYIEVETEIRWAGQQTQDGLSAVLGADDLVPILTDIQRRSWQHNLVYLRRDLVSKVPIAALSSAYLRQVEALLAAPG